MPVTVDTSTSTTAVAYSSQRRLTVASNGNRWVGHYSGSNIEFWYSTNDGGAFTQDTTGGTLTGTNVDLFIDKDDYAHAVVDNGSAIVYYRGTPNAGKTSWTWTGGTTVSSATGNGYPTVVAHREGTGWKAHIVWSRNFSSSYGHNEYRCKCDSSGIHTSCVPIILTCTSHGHTTYTPWSTSQWNCVCGGDCNSWQNGWHSHSASGCTGCVHLHACSSATQESRFIQDGTTTDNYVYYARYDITSGDTITVDQSPTVIAGTYGNNTPTYPTLDFHHTGDHKTVKDSAPHVFVSWSATETGTGDGIRFRKNAYSGGTWSWGTDQDIITTEYIYSSYISGTFDGTRFVCAYSPSGATTTIKLFERDVGDTATTWRTVPALSDGNITGLSVTTEGDRVFVYASGATSDDLEYIEYDRATNTWDASWTTADTTTTVAGNVTTKRGTGSGTSGPGHEALYLTGAGSPYDIEHELVNTNTPPIAPLWLSPTDGDPADVAEILTLDWQFQDPQPADTQSAYTVRKREGTAAYEYWNGSTWDSSESGSTKIVSAGTELALAASWGADGDDEHFYSVKTWDASDAGPSAWSTELEVVPSGQDNPTITTITTINTTVYEVTWTVTSQTKFRLRVYGDDTGIDRDALFYDSGEVISGIASHNTPFPTNSVTRWVSLYTWNDEGLLSDEDTEDATVSFTGPDTPTLVVSVHQVLGDDLFPKDAALEVAITNPATGTAVTHNDIYRREVGDTDNGIRVAAELATNTEWIDWAVASGVDYEYLVRAVATSNGTSTDSAWTD